MRVLYFVERFWPLVGGVEVISARMVPALRDRGHELIVVTAREHDWLPEHDSYLGVPVRRLPIVEAILERDVELVAQARAGVAEVMADFRPDLVHATFTGPSIFFLPRTRPLLLSFHGSWPELRRRADGLLPRVFARADWVTACSRYAERYLIDLDPSIAGRTSAILNGLDPVVDEPPDPPDGPPVLLCSGRIVVDKGFDVALEAFAEVASRLPDIRLVIAGDGPVRGELEARAAALGLADRVEFPGWISPERTAELTARATLVLVPSRLEGFGLVALEAALMARPVVASDIGGLPEVVLDGITGTLVPVDEVPAFAEAILTLLDDPGRRSTMGRAARARALDEFSARRHIDEWDELYRRLGAASTHAS